jgi:hypothetical protein
MQNKYLHVSTEKQRERTTSYTDVSVANIKRIRKISKKPKAHKKQMGRKGKFHIQVLYLRKYNILKILITFYYVLVCTVVRATTIWP